MVASRLDRMVTQEARMCILQDFSRFFCQNVECRMLYFTPWIWKVAHPVKYFSEKTNRMKEDMHLFELIFLEDVLYIPNLLSQVTFRELLKRSENENIASTISSLQKRILFLYQWHILREEQIKFWGQGFKIIYLVCQ